MTAPRCKSCGATDRQLRRDGQCFRCHLKTIGFAFKGPVSGRQGWTEYTTTEFIDEHVGAENIRSDTVEKVV